jgi:ATP-dependent Clp protease ATP-binding subunit ClpC
LGQEDSRVAEILRTLGVSSDRFRARLIQIAPRVEDRPPSEGQLPFTPRAKKVLELSLREALSLGTSQVTTEMLLLGLAREGDGVAMQILVEWDVSSEQIRNAVMKVLPDPRPVAAEGHRSVPVVGPEIRVGHSLPVRRLLMTAAARALDHGRVEMSARDLLIALTRDEHWGPVLAELGANETALRATLDRHGDSPEAAAGS